MGKKSREKWRRRLEQANAPGADGAAAAEAPVASAPIGAPSPAPTTAPARKNTAELVIVSRHPNASRLVALGPMVDARWSVPKSHADALAAAGRDVPPELEGAMLVDTGATFTSIDLDFANQLGLKQVAIAQMYGAHGLQGSPVFEAHIQVLAERGGMKVWIDSDLQVAGIKDLQAFGKSNGQTVPCIGLLGRDFLSYGTMTYDGPKAVVEIRVPPVLRTVPADPPATATVAAAPGTPPAKA